MPKNFILTPCLQGIRSPLIAEESGAEKELKLRFDVSQYSPEEIMVSVTRVIGTPSEIINRSLSLRCLT